MKELNNEELKNVNGGAIGLIVAGIVGVIAGVVVGVEVADYYLE
jgi:lactobin A/cerein 7B family class IIb bacteriocin